MCTYGGGGGGSVTLLIGVVTLGQFPAFLSRIIPDYQLLSRFTEFRAAGEGVHPIMPRLYKQLFVYEQVFQYELASIAGCQQMTFLVDAQEM